MQFIFLILILPLLILLWRIWYRPIKKYKSPISGTIDVVVKYNGEKMLRINNYTQGISIDRPSITKSYWYAVAKKAVEHCEKKQVSHHLSFRPSSAGEKSSRVQKISHPSGLKMTNARKNACQVIFLGLGANTSSALVGQFNPTIKQTIVEIDPVIIRACREYFQLDDLPNATVIEEDAFVYIQKAVKEKRRFDVVVVDIFTGREPFVAKGTEKPTFIKQIEKILKKDGIMIFNRPDDSQVARGDTRELIGYLSQHFGEVTDEYIHDPRGYRNDVITARK